MPEKMTTNQQAIYQSFDLSDNGKADTASSDYDLLSAIKTKLRASPVQWDHRHVKGHQDDDGTKILDRWEMLNTEMDGIAKTIWALQYDEPLDRNSKVDGEYWPLFIHGRKVTGRLNTAIYDSIHGEAILKRWMEKERFLVEMF